MKMILNPKNGIAQLLFGMKQNDVSSIYGNPDKNFKDDDGNIIFLYNELKCRLTFYEDEDFRLGYIISSHPELELLGVEIMGKNVAKVKAKLPFKNWEQEDFDSTENHFNESNWIVLQSEYGEIIRAEIGAIINDDDNFEWKFKK